MRLPPKIYFLILLALGATSSLHSQPRITYPNLVEFFYQAVRANTGVTPDGYAGHPINATRSITHSGQLNTLTSAQTGFNATGVNVQNVFSLKIGEGCYSKNHSQFPLDYVLTNSAVAVFGNGCPLTLHPKLP